jgi:hypothetical protein
MHYPKALKYTQTGTPPVSMVTYQSSCDGRTYTCLVSDVPEQEQAKWSRHTRARHAKRVAQSAAECASCRLPTPRGVEWCDDCERRRLSDLEEREWIAERAEARR